MRGSFVSGKGMNVKMQYQPANYAFILVNTMQPDAVLYISGDADELLK